MMQAERQRKWYLGLSEEQREARRAYQRSAAYCERKNRRERARRCEKDDPEFAAYLRGEIAFEDMTPLPTALPVEAVPMPEAPRPKARKASPSPGSVASRIIEEALDRRDESLLRVLFQGRRLHAVVALALDGTEHERAAARAKLLDPNVRHHKL